jgi:dihydrolipoamide dehydrogenase
VSALPQPPRLNMAKAVAFTQNVVKRMTSGIGTLMKGNGIDIFDGLGTADAARSVTVTQEGKSAQNNAAQQEFSADKIILATGSD